MCTLKWRGEKYNPSALAWRSVCAGQFALTECVECLCLSEMWQLCWQAAQLLPSTSSCTAGLYTPHSASQRRGLQRWQERWDLLTPAGDCSHLVLVLLSGCSLHVVLSTGVRHADHWADLAADLPLTVLTEMLMTTAGLANADTNTATLLLPLLRYGEQPMAELSASWPPPPSQSGPGKMRDILSEWSPLFCSPKLRAFCRAS